MLLLVVAVLAAAGALALYLLVERQGAGGIPLALLRAVAWGTVAALLLDPALRRVHGGPIVLLDGSLSMTDPGGDTRWRAAVDTATTVCGSRWSGSLPRPGTDHDLAALGRGCAGRILVFGSEPRLFTDSITPNVSQSLLLPALREAAARGGPLVIVTDGGIDDAGSLPADLLARARVITLPRAAGRDAGVAAFDLPAALRAGDTARVTVDVVAERTQPGDTALVELLEQGRIVARTRIALGAGGVMRRELAFVPAPASADREVRRYEVRLSGVRADQEPRDDVRASAASVTRSAAVALFSDSPDWDFRWLSQALIATSGVPVKGFVRPAAGGGWRDARTLRQVSDADVRAEASQASLVVVHGSPENIAALERVARGAVLRWPARGTAAVGDWYVAPQDVGSPIGGALAGVPAESLPPLEAVLDQATDSVAWTGLRAQLDRRGRARPVVMGVTRHGRRAVMIGGAGFWRWASRGGAAADAYRALMAATTDWLLEERTAAPPQLLALRDSLSRGINEFLPRPPSLHPQAGSAAASVGEPVPLRHVAWVYWIALGALVAEWIARRRRGLR